MESLLLRCTEAFPSNTQRRHSGDIMHASPRCCSVLNDQKGVWSRPVNLEVVSVDQNRPMKPWVLRTVILNTSWSGNSPSSPASLWVVQGALWVLRVYVSVQSDHVKPLQAPDLIGYKGSHKWPMVYPTEVIDTGLVRTSLQTDLGKEWTKGLWAGTQSCTYQEPTSACHTLVWYLSRLKHCTG